MERWDSLGGKEGHTKIQISAEPGRKVEILTTEPTMPFDNNLSLSTRSHILEIDLGWLFLIR